MSKKLKAKTYQKIKIKIKKQTVPPSSLLPLSGRDSITS
jgi:hypothetical protein